jgi:hypothetical protein
LSLSPIEDFASPYTPMSLRKCNCLYVVPIDETQGTDDYKEYLPMVSTRPQAIWRFSSSTPNKSLTASKFIRDDVLGAYNTYE